MVYSLKKRISLFLYYYQVTKPKKKWMFPISQPKTYNNKYRLQKRIILIWKIHLFIYFKSSYRWRYICHCHSQRNAHTLSAEFVAIQNAVFVKA